MEPQIIDYYNEEPQMMKIIEKMNEEFSDLQNEYEKLKKELNDYKKYYKELARSGGLKNHRIYTQLFSKKN